MSVRNSIRDAIRSAIGLVEEVFNPQTLFLSGERGVWYDPSDLSTLFQDAAGTIPVTGTGQPVGLMLDKRLGLVRGPELVVNGTFDSSLTGWNPHGAWSWDSSGKAKLTGTGNPESIFQGKVFVVGKTYEITFDLEFISGSGGFGFENLAAVVVTPFTSSGTCKAIWTADKAELAFKRSSGTITVTLDNVSIKELPGNHARQATAASRPIFRDVGGLRYLECDGVDDGMVTGSIDFTGTDKMLAVVGVRKLSDAASGAPIGLGVNQTGSFELVTCTSFGGTRDSYQVSVGAAEVSKVAYRPFAAPISNVLSCVLDTTLGSASTEITTRFDGTLVAPTNTIGSVTGNFGNYPLYLFRRDGTTLPFNGLFYGAIIAGSTYSAAQIASAERYLAGKSGVTL